MKRLVMLIVFVAGTLDASESITLRAGVATGSRYATQSAIAVLRAGGTAMDAATAAAFMIAVTRPDAAGIGGGGLLVYYDKAENATWSVDFRETAPWSPLKAEEGAATPASPHGIDAAGTPGFVAGLREAQQRFGREKWGDLLQPAILAAKEGFEVDDALTTSLHAAEEVKSLDALARATLLGDGKPGVTPRRIVQPDLATTLTRIARTPEDFYVGATASKIAEHFGSESGRLTIRDLKEYRPVWRAPLRIELGALSIQTAPPPSRGGVAIAAMLAILGSYEFASADLEAPGAMHLLAEAERRATFDARRVVADPVSSRIPISSILSAERAAFWRSTILADRATSTPSISASATTSSVHTTHISIVDPFGNVASLTVSLSGNFGSGVMVPGTGVLLNAAMRDFTVSPAPHANAREPRKRPATPIAPMIVFRGATPFLAAGASGGDAIPGCLTALIIRVTQKGATLREAIEAPRIHQPDFPDRITFEPALEQTARKLEAIGHSVVRVTSIGEINAVMIDGERIISISDPRGKGSSGGF